MSQSGAFMRTPHAGRRRRTIAMVGLMLSFRLARLFAAETINLADVVQPYIDRHQIAGAVAMVVDRNEALYTEAFGYANIERSQPMKADTLFWIASMSKPITAVAVMMLVDAGKISLDDPVQKYLPDFAPQIEVVSTKGDRVSLKPPARPISLRHVLSHMSGLDFNTAIERPVLDAFPLSVRVKSYGLSQLQFEPGSDFSYSNAGINTAARVVEVVSGMPFEAYLQRHLFNPLGMKDSTFYPSAAQIARLATSYMFADGDGGLEEIPLSQLHAPTYQISRQFVIPAGGLFSTAADIGIFCRMLLNGGVLDGKRYLSESAIHEMVRNQLPDAIARRNGWEQGYGLGWAPGAGGSFGHSGAYATNMSVDPVHGLATIWMVQIAGGAGAASGQAFNKAAIARFSALANQTAE